MARGEDGGAARRALEELCQAYWYPLYGFARMRGLSPADAEDAVQAFFLKLVEHGSFSRADRERGRLRSFLLGGFSKFLVQRWRNARAEKRGGGASPITIDRAWAESRLAGHVDDKGDEADFDREWARALIGRVFERLRAYHESRGRTEVFDRLKTCLLSDESYGDEAELAEELGLSGAGVRSAVFQMRQRFRRYVEEEVRDTVGSESELREEIAHLCRALAAQGV